jgi:hypothetical protein
MGRNGDDDEALRWEGDDDATLAPGWKRAGEPAHPAGSTSSDGVSDAAASASADGESVDVQTGAARQPGSAELVLLGVFGGVYLLYTIGWMFSVLRVQNPGADPLAQVMFTLGLWLAVLAPALWFGVTFTSTRGRTVARLVWLLVGAIVLIPVAFVAGVTA